MRVANHKLIEQLESERRAAAYGKETKLFHLLVVAVVSAAFFVVRKVRQWFYLPPSPKVVIDNVVVEVYEEDSVVDVGHVAAALCFLCLLGVVLLRVWGSKVPFTKKPKPTTMAENKPSSVEQKEAMSSALRPRDVQWWSGVTAAPSSGKSVQGAERSQCPITTANDLDALIVLGDSRPQHNTAASSIGYHPFVSQGPRQALNGAGAVAVRYGQDGEGGKSTKSRQATTAESELSALGITSIERSTARLKEWIAGICATVVEEIDRCDRWFADKRYSAFDCNHPLSEWHEIPAAARPAPAATGGWGFSAAPAAAALPTTDKIRKSTALDNERKKLQLQPSASTETYDMISRLEQRLSLERVLDTSITFPCGDLSAAAARRRQSAVLRSLRAFASSRNLSNVGKSNSTSSFESGDAPADAYLLVHILRIRVPSLSSYFRLPYETPAATPQELLLYVGGNGEPYFYVKHRTGSQEHIMKTAEGPESLFEALLLFFAVVRRYYYGGSYGNVTGVVDLRQLGIDTLF